MSKPSPAGKVAARTGLFAYQQAFGIAGALSLANMLRLMIDWKEIVLAFVSAWTEFIRPIAAWLFGWLFDLVHLNLSPFWKDYLSIGIIIAMGFLRHFVILNFRIKQLEDPDADYHKGKTPIIPLHMTWWQNYSPIIMFFLSPIVWPITVIGYLVTLLTSGENWRFIVYSTSSIVLPFYYLIVLAALNWALN